MKLNAFFIIFKGILIVRDCLRLKSTPLLGLRQSLTIERPLKMGEIENIFHHF